MEVEHTVDAKIETLVVTPTRAWLPVLFTALPVMIATQVVFIAFTRSLPLTLWMLLAAVLASSIALAGISLELLARVRIALNRQGMDVAKLINTETYRWSDIGEIRLVTSNGTLADEASGEDLRRVGIGIFLKSKASKTGDDPTAREADAMLLSAETKDVLQLQSIIESIVAFQKRALDGSLAQPKRIHSTAKPLAEFRRRPRIDGRQNDPKDYAEA